MMAKYPEFSNDMTYHVIEDYKSLIKGRPYVADLLEAILQEARNEIVSMKDEVPFIRECFTTDDDIEMLDMLVAKAGEENVNKVHFENKPDKMIQCFTVDNLAKFCFVIEVYILGTVNHWADESIKGGIRVFVHPRWEKKDKYLDPFMIMLLSLVKTKRVLRGVESLDFYIASKRD